MVNWIRIGTSNTPDTLPPLDQSANSISINATGIYQAPREGQLIIKPLRDNISNYDSDPSGAVLLGYTTPSGELVQAGWLPAGGGGAPTGMISPYAGTATPDGWLLCDGASKSTVGTYAPLFAIIAYTYGGGGSNFNLPDLRGRTIFGSSDGVTNVAAYGPNCEDHILVGHMPSHTHGGIKHRHQQDHTHSWPTYDPDNNGTSATVRIPAGVAPYNTDYTNFTQYRLPEGGPWVSGSSVWSGGAQTTASSGGGAAFLSPTVVINYLIKY